MRKILDLGCGAGESWRTWKTDVEGCQIVGMDLERKRLQTAYEKYGDRGWHYIRARGERIPLADGSVSGVISRAALPYMAIPVVLEELHRVLEPGGWLKTMLHSSSFTWGELRQSFPRPIPTLFRSFVFLNGMYFHLTGKVIGSGRFVESCQTEAGMRMAHRRAGFEEIKFLREKVKLIVEARRQGTAGELRLTA